MASKMQDSTRVLLSSISLPDDPILQYAIYSSTSSTDPLTPLESLRRKLLPNPPTNAQEEGGGILSNPITRIHFISAHPLLYIFHVVPGEGPPPEAITLDDGLTRIADEKIIIDRAVHERMLCPGDHGRGQCNCSSNNSNSNGNGGNGNSSSQSATRAIPGTTIASIEESAKDSNLAQKLFLDAVRDRLVDEICVASLGKGHIPAVRLHNGFVLLPPRRNMEWAGSWERGNEGMIFCEMQLHLTATHILVQPLPCVLSSLAPLSFSTITTTSAPGLSTGTPGVQPGAAILLLPHGIPAFFMQPHTADDNTLSEFTQSLSENGVSYSQTLSGDVKLNANANAITKEFVRCYVPFRRVNERQDGGITTVWPRALVLATPGRPSLPSLSGTPPNGTSTNTLSGAQAQATAQAMGAGVMGRFGGIQRTNTGTSTPNLTSLSLLPSLPLQSAVSLSTLSSAMGAFVDAAMKERERPKGSLPPQPLQGAQQQQRMQVQNDNEVVPQDAHASEAAPPATTQLPVRPENAAAQSYPSPLEMTVGRGDHSSTSATHQHPKPTADPETIPTPVLSGPAPIEQRADTPPSSSQNALSSSNPMNPPNALNQLNPLNNINPLNGLNMGGWDIGGFGDGGFGFGGGSGMSFDPFSTGFTEDDFSLFDAVPVVHDTGAGQDGNGIGDSNGSSRGQGTSGDGTLPDVMLALSGQTQDFGMEWNMSEAGAGGFTVVGEATTLQDGSHGLDTSDFDLSSFDNPQLLALLGKPHAGPDILLEGDSTIPSIQLPQLDGSSSPVVEEEEEELHPTPGFGAVRFGKDHNLLDEKYYNGKYSLPSPPPDRPTVRAAKPHTPKPEYISVEAVKDDSTKYSKAVGMLSNPLRASTAREGDLRGRYMAATHPSHAILYKLAGTKRFWEVANLAGPMPGTGLGGTGSGSVTPVANGAVEPSLESPSKKRRLTWGTANEAWRNPTPPAEESDDEDEGDGDSSMAGDDAWGDENDFDVHMDGVELTSPMTGYYSSKLDLRYENPIKLLQVRFDRSWLVEHELVSPSDITLPTAVSSASSLLSPYRTNAPLVPMSVPTPVSPEAQPSSNDGPARLASHVACRFAKEVGRNPLWNAVVVAMREISPVGAKVKRELWQVEVDVVVDALQRAKCAVWGKSIAEITESEEDSSVSSPPEATPKAGQSALDHIQLLQSPKIHLGHGMNVIEALPSITRFWDKLNVTPLNGPKDVHCVALISDTGGIRLDQAEAWLKKLGKTYGVRRLGSHKPLGIEQNQEGVAAIKWEKLRSICNTLVRAAKETQSKPLIVYVIVPNTFADLSHPAAVPVLNTIAEVSSPRIATPGTVVFMLIPEVFLSHSRSLSQNADFGMERLALTVYDAFPRTVFRQHSRLSAKKYGVDEIFDAFAFVLAGRRPPKAIFIEKWPAPTPDMFDRYAFLHAAYSISANGEWVVATLVTETGDDLESQVWRVDEHDALNSIVRNVFDFVLRHALRANVEWRVTLSKSGIMSLTELNAWTSELASRIDHVDQSMHLTLLSVSSGDAPVFMDTPKLEQLPIAAFIPPRSENPKENNVIVDASSEAFLIFPQPINMLPSVVDQIVGADFLSSRIEDVQIDSLATPIMTCWLLHLFRRPEATQPHDASRSLTASSSSISSSQIHALHLVRFGSSTYSAERDDHMRDIATNFYDLTILHEIRTGFTGGETTSKQPLHVAVVNSMTTALEGLQL